VKRALLLTLLMALGPRAHAGEVLVAAAADLSGAVRELAAAFQKASGHTVKLSPGSSGTFHAQIVNGAPFDVFLSADMDYVRDLEKRGLTEPASLFTYAIGRLVVWVPKASPLDVSTSGLRALADSRVRKIAIANPAHAPYGRAAEAALRQAGVLDSAKARLVLGENVLQAAQFAQSGAADAGIVALSLAVAEPLKSAGRYWEIPETGYPRMEQGAALLRQARKAGHLPAAQAFLALLKGADGQAVLRRYGFGIPR
jgi:molybdate transport system substrate-binding protein